MKLFFKIDRTIAMSILFVGGAAALISFLSPPVYKAAMQISIDPGTVSSAMTRSGDSWQAYIEKERGAIKNKELLGKVTEKLHLRFSRKFSGKDPVSILWRKIKVEPIGGTNLVNINVYMDDPELASKISAALAEAYIATKEEKKFALTKEAVAWFKEGSELSKRISDSTAALNKFVAENKLESLKEDIEKTKERLDSLMRKRDQKAASIRDAQKSLEDLEPILAEGDKEKLFFLLKDDLNVTDMRNAKEQVEFRITKLKTIYEESHPEVIKLRKELEDIDSRVTDIANGMVESSRAETEASKKDIRTLSVDTAKIKQRLDRMKEVETKLDDLARKLDIAQKFYDEFLTRLKEGRFSLVEVTNLGLVGQQEAATKPVGPKKTRNIILGVLAGFILGNIISTLMKKKARAALKIDKHV